MSLFNLSDIQIKTNSDTKELKKDEYGDLNITDDASYNLNSFRYPIDIGAADKGHYMVININKQIKTQYQSDSKDFGNSHPTDIPTVEKRANEYSEELGSSLNAVSSVFSSAGVIGKQFLSNGRIDATSFNTQIYPDFTVTKKNQIFGQLNKGSFLRTIKRTTDTVALYMPDTLQFSYNQGYTDLQINKGMFPLIAAAGDSVQNSLKNNQSLRDIGVTGIKNLTPFAARSLLEETFGDAGKAAAAGFLGTVNNPQLELLYSSPEFRTFRFEFLMYPRSSKEAEQVNAIIERLKFHQAPEILGKGNIGGVGALFLVPPSEFDISFYYNGQINKNIPNISTCVLQSIDTDYAPNGQFSAYELENSRNPSIGGTGMPVGIRLSLTFKETVVLTKFDYKNSTPTAITSR